VLFFKYLCSQRDFEKNQAHQILLFIKDYFSEVVLVRVQRITFIVYFAIKYYYKINAAFTHVGLTTRY